MSVSIREELSSQNTAIYTAYKMINSICIYSYQLCTDVHRGKFYSSQSDCLYFVTSFLCLCNSITKINLFTLGKHNGDSDTKIENLVTYKCAVLLTNVKLCTNDSVSRK